MREREIERGREGEILLYGLMALAGDLPLHFIIDCVLMQHLFGLPSQKW